MSSPDFPASSNIAQTLGALLLANGFYGPAEGPPAIVRKPHEREATREHRADDRAKEIAASRSYKGQRARIYEALPIGSAAALPCSAIAAALGLDTQTVQAALSDMKVPRVGAFHHFRFYRER